MRPFFAGIACSAAIAAGFVGILTVPSPAPAEADSMNRSTTLVAQTSTSSLAAIEQSAFQQVNKYRASKGLPALVWNDAIAQQARIHSQNMANGKVPFSHNGFDQRIKAIAQTIPYRAAAENVAYNQGYKDPATSAVQGWIKSTGHRTNIEANNNLSGLGVAKNAKGEYYFTQIFIRRR